MQRQRFWASSLFLGIWMLALLVPHLSEALVVSSTGRVNFRDEGVAEGSSGTVNCQGAGIACEMVNGILNINVSGGGLDSGLEDPGGNGLVNRTGVGVTAPYAGTSCTNQVLRVLSAAGAGTCVTLTSAYVDASIALTAGHLGQFAATTSAQLAGVLSDESGASGVFVRTGAKLDVFSATTSAELATVLSDESGASGAFVRTGAKLDVFGATTSAELATVLSDENGVTGGFVRTGAKLDVFSATTSTELATVLSDESGGTGGFVRTGAKLDVFSATTSAELATVLSDETGGTGGFVRAGGTVALATALAANGANCAAGQFPLGVDASGAVESCTALPTTITGTANQITASASTGPITLAFPTNMTLPGTTTGTFSGGLTGTASLATALAANGANCSAESAPVGVDASGAVEGCFAVQPTVTWGSGLSLTGATAAVASTEANFLTDGVVTDLVCGAAAQGKMQVMDAGTLQYCGGETTALLWKGFLTQSGLSWNVVAGTCTGDTNGGKLTINGSAQIVCASDTGGEGGPGGSNTFAASDFNLTGDDVSLDYINATMATGSNNGFLSSTDFTLFSAKQEAVAWGAGLVFAAGIADVASQEAGFLADGAITDLVCGGGAVGKVQVMNSGALQYCDGADDAVLRAGFLLPTPLTWNITAATCTGDASGGKLTVNGSNQVVCASDVVGEGGAGTGDLTAFGTCSTGDCATTGAPLTNFWLVESSVPSSPASTQGRVWLDNTSKNYSMITSDGVIKRLVQSVAAVPNQVLTALATDGAFSQAQLASANLSDGSTLVRLTEPQILEGKQLVPRVTTLSASSGTVTAPNADLYDVFERHDVAGTLTIPSPTASGMNPRPQQAITFSLYAASAQTVVWDTGYAIGYGVALPTTIPAGQYVAVGMRWNVLSGKWETWGNTADTVAAVVDGGTGVSTLTGLAIGNGTSAFTAMTSSTVGQIPRVTGANTYAFGALDLADTDAVTNVLPNANTTAASANTASAIVARDGSGNFTAGTITAALTGNASTATALQADLPYAAFTPATAASKLLGRGDGGAGDWQEITLGTNLSMSGTTLNATGGGGGGTGTLHLFVGSPKLPSTNPAIIDGGGNFYKVGYDETTSWCAWWQIEVPKDYVGSPVFEGTVSPVGSTTGSLIFDVAVMAVTAGDSATIETDSYDTVNTCTLAAIPTTLGYPGRISCALTNNDSMAAEDGLRIKVCRNISDTAATRMNLSYAVIQYAR